MAASNTRFTQNRLGQSKNPIDSDHGIYRYAQPMSASGTNLPPARKFREAAECYPAKIEF